MKDNEKSENQSLELAKTSFNNFRDLNDMLEFGKQICISELSPLKTPNDVVAALLMGKELGLGVMTSINNIYPINGKASSGIHIIAAQLLKAGITYSIIADYEPVFQVSLRTKDENGKDIPVLNKDAQGNPVPVFVGKARHTQEVRENEKKGSTIIDYVTIIKFNRVVKQPDGTYLPMEIISEFYYTDIPEALLKKDNWKNWLKLMMYSRCFTNGSKRIGDDVLLGLSETSELADLNNIPYKIEDGVAVIIQSDKKVTNKEESNVKETKIEEATILEDNNKA
jgi:hypothetical protein